MLYRCFGRPCTSARMPGRGEFAGQALARCLDCRLALGALAVQQRGDAPVVVGLQEAEGQVLDLPLQLPDAEPVGQRREHLQRLAAPVRAGRLRAGRCSSAASAAARSAAAAPRADRWRMPAASCARARSAEHAARPRAGRHVQSAGSAPAGACAPPGRHTIHRRPCAPPPRVAAQSHRHRPDRPQHASTAPRRCCAGWRPRPRRAPSRLRRCRAPGGPAAVRQRPAHGATRRSRSRHHPARSGLHRSGPDGRSARRCRARPASRRRPAS